MMQIDPNVLHSLAASVGALGADYMKGITTEAGKASWGGLKSLFGWQADPDPQEIPEKITDALAASPDLLEDAIRLVKDSQSRAAMQLVGTLTAQDSSKVVVAHSVGTLNM